MIREYFWAVTAVAQLSSDVPDEATISRGLTVVLPLGLCVPDDPAEFMEEDVGENLEYELLVLSV
ncbi:MAG: hypothetical protein L0I06_08585, partial [Acidipropionibacterium jensenii]|nr:hypothetical protein [Acidipropionibacterium jensenii]